MSIRSSWIQKSLASTALLVILGGSTFAQSGSTEEGKRKAKTKIASSMSEVAAYGTAVTVRKL